MKYFIYLSPMKTSKGIYDFIKTQLKQRKVTVNDFLSQADVPYSKWWRVGKNNGTFEHEEVSRMYEVLGMERGTVIIDQ